MSEKTKTVQPEVTIGLFGHVDHGKTTLTEKLSGKWTDTHSEELKRGITIRLGYADTILRKCPKCKGEYTTSETCPKCKGKATPLRKVSFVDAPGHESLMATMLSGATIIDGALLLVAANERCPQPQTREHLMALKIIGVKNVIVVQNKIDLVTEEEALDNYNKIKRFMELTDFKDAPIIPISAQFGINIGFLIEAMETVIKTPKRDASVEPWFLVARSFDINRPGADPEKLAGGVLGGVLIQGQLKAGDKIQICPGRKVEREGKVSFEPLLTTIFSIRTGGENVNHIYPGGSIGLQTNMDPSLVGSDKLSGAVCGMPGKLPPVLYELKLATKLLKRVVGAKDKLVVEPLKQLEWLMLNVNTTATVGQVTELSKDRLSCKLKLPVCAAKGSRVTVSRMIANRWRLIGYGIIE
jgi:translation initiation factor 2 subunit 3